MGTDKQEVERMEILLKAVNKVFGALQVRHNDAMALLRKLHNRANPSIMDDNSQTRLDPDIQDELELILYIQPNDAKEETRPD